MSIKGVRQCLSFLPFFSAVDLRLSDGLQKLVIDSQGECLVEIVAYQIIYYKRGDAYPKEVVRYQRSAVAEETASPVIRDTNLAPEPWCQYEVAVLPEDACHDIPQIRKPSLLDCPQVTALHILHAPAHIAVYLS